MLNFIIHIAPSLNLRIMLSARIPSMERFRLPLKLPPQRQDEEGDDRGAIQVQVLHHQPLYER